jgi:mRNA interferase RelE/StbE
VYEVRYAPEARRALGGIPDKARPAIFEMVDGVIAENPQRAGKPLSLELAGRWSARRGEYRIVYEIDEETQTVTIVHVAHRRDAYRRR